MEKPLKNRNKIIFFNLLSTIVLQGLTFFSAPVFSDILGTANYGIVSVYNTWVNIFATVCSLQAASTIALARSNFPIEDQEKYQSSVLSMAVGIYLCFFAVIEVVFQGHTEILGLSKYMLPLALVQGLGNYCVNIINSKFTYEFKAVQNFVLSVCLSVINIGLSLFLIYRFNGDNNYWGRILGESITYTAFGVFAFIFIISKGRLIYKKEYWKFSFPIAFPTVFHLLAGLLLGQSDRLMLQHMLDNSSVGIYTLAASFSTVIQSIWVAFNNSWAPFYYEYTRLDENDEMHKRARNYTELLTVIVCGFILLSYEVYHVFAPREYWGGTGFVPLFALGYYFVFLYSFPVNFEFYHKKTKLIAIATMIAAVLNIILNYAFIKSFGIVGAVIATTVAHCLQFLIHFVFAKRLINEDYPFKLKPFIPWLLMVCAACAVFYLTPNLWFVRWGIGVVLGIYELRKMFMRKAIF